MRKRVLALICCLSLTLGLFTYRPPEAKAIVTEASLATSVLWSFMQSAGITLNGTGVNSSSWAEAIEPRLREFTEWIDPKAASFWSWLGYEDGATGFLKDLTWSVFEGPSTVPGYKIHVPAPVAKKFADFTSWFAGKMGLSSGSGPVPVVESDFLSMVVSNAILGLQKDSSHEKVIKSLKNAKYRYAIFVPRGSSSVGFGDQYSIFWCDTPIKFFYVLSEPGFIGEKYFKEPGVYIDGKTWYSSPGRDTYIFSSDFTPVGGVYYDDLRKFCDYVPGVRISDYEKASSITVAQPGALSPTYDDSGDKATVLTVPGIEGQVSTINDLLQQILDKLAANDLNSSASLEGEAAPDVPATDIGWKGTIEKIYQAIIDLPGRIADAFKALLEGLFAPDTALMQEISTTFTDKFPFLPVLNRVGRDLFGMTAESEPPVIWIHLEDAEGKYTYGDKTKVLDMSFYKRYKADADKLISGFLWLGFLWLLFKRASAIIQGSEMLTEYSEAIDRGYRERKGKKTK